MNKCILHLDFSVRFTGPRCPVCEKAFALMAAKAKLSLANGEIKRLKTVGKERQKLQSRIWELEDRFATELECNFCDGDGTGVCPSCRGNGTYGARPDDFGHPVTCRECDGSGSVKCSDCKNGVVL